MGKGCSGGSTYNVQSLECKEDAQCLTQTRGADDAVAEGARRVRAMALALADCVIGLVHPRSRLRRGGQGATAPGLTRVYIYFCLYLYLYLYLYIY